MTCTISRRAHLRTYVHNVEEAWHIYKVYILCTLSAFSRRAHLRIHIHPRHICKGFMEYYDIHWVHGVLWHTLSSWRIMTYTECRGCMWIRRWARLEKADSVRHNMPWIMHICDVIPAYTYLVVQKYCFHTFENLVVQNYCLFCLCLLRPFSN